MPEQQKYYLTWIGPGMPRKFKLIWVAYDDQNERIIFEKLHSAEQKMYINFKQEEIPLEQFAGLGEGISKISSVDELEIILKSFSIPKPSEAR